MSGLGRPDSERWILKQWVKSDVGRGEYEYCEIDVARARLIRDLRDDSEVDKASLPVAMLTTDHLHQLRRRICDIRGALFEAAPATVPGGIAEEIFVADALVA